MSDISGMLCINKPAGITSYDVVRRVKRVLQMKKVGHCGTLDPFAEGVLLVVFGSATKLQSLLMGQRKRYHARLRLGLTTDTGDITGNMTGRAPLPAVGREEMAKILERFTGEIEQVPPMYSALKKNGVRLYVLARQGLQVERAPRRVTIHALETVAFEGDRLEIRVECSSGTYIRTLGEDIGAALGCGATVEFLCREKVYPFSVDAALDGRALPAMSREHLLRKAYSAGQIHDYLGTAKLPS